MSGDNENQDYWQCIVRSSSECVHWNVKWDLYLSEYLTATSRKQSWPSSSQWLHSSVPQEMYRICASHLFITLRGLWYICREIRRLACVRTHTTPWASLSKKLRNGGSKRLALGADTTFTFTLVLGTTMELNAASSLLWQSSIYSKNSWQADCTGKLGPKSAPDWLRFRSKPLVNFLCWPLCLLA